MMTISKYHGKLALSGFVLGLATLMWSPASFAEASPVSPVSPEAFMTVNGQVLSSEDVEMHFYNFARSKLYHGGSKEEEAALRKTAAKAFVIEQLLQQEGDKRDIEPDSVLVDGRIADLRRRYEGSPTWATAKQNLPKIRAKFEADSREEILKVRISEVEAPSQTDLQNFHKENIDLFTQPEEYHLSVILLSVDPSSTAAIRVEVKRQGNELAEAIRQGGDFAELARGVSSHATASEGGDVGYVHLEQLYEPTHEIVQALTPGQVSDPVRVLEGFVIFRLEDRREAVARSFEDVPDRVLALYMRETADDQWTGFQEQIWNDAVIETSVEAAFLIEQ